ncbi:ABC transporter permease [Salegentibacter sp. LM13S]|uniref:ABC transporter permease n=1 Tax=Salegentibacter lacus TaxID=2873599 RepID=UPI001CCB799D|nr:ABC transporter permease [Salegentibacter lacus]MBZ9629721.1 ABC transporter permease [Salegentibacter lacus]
MIRNYIKIAFRNLNRNKLYSTINIGGFALGLSACILIMFYVTHEKSYDTFHEDSKRIFNVFAKTNISGDVIRMNSLSSVAAKMIEDKDPNVSSAIKIKTEYNPVIIKNPENQSQFSETDLVYTDSNFFNFFSFKLINGNPETALERPYSIILSENLAKKYFGETNPIGRNLSLRIDSTYTFTVTGISEETPSNSSIKTDLIVSASSLNTMKEAFYDMRSQIFQGGSFQTFVKLKDPEKVAPVQRSMNALAVQGHEESTDEYFLTNITDIHLLSRESTNVKYVKIFSLVALLILLLALINYISLSTARAGTRAKEIGVRKMNGASQRSVAVQFFLESAVYVFISFLLAILFTILLKPWFFSLVGIQIDSSFFFDPGFISTMVGILVLTIFIAGLYPAIILSSYQPIETLKGNFGNRKNGAQLRQVFTIFQFVVAVGLIISGIVIHQQINHLRTLDTGLSRTDVLMVPLQNTMDNSQSVFREEVENLPGVRKIAAASLPMYGGTNMYFVDDKNSDGQIPLPILATDHEFIDALDIEWSIPLQDENIATKKNSVIINEATINKLHLNPNPIGEIIVFGNSQYEVVGVVKDFYYDSPNNEIGALAMFVSPSKEFSMDFGEKSSCLFIKFRANANVSSIIKDIEGLYKKYDTENAFEYQFMDEAFDALFRSEMRLAKVLNVFIGLIVLISGMGLFGYATFSAQERKKEIGVRKVLGAKVTQITYLLSVDFLKLVMVAILIASPIAWYVMQQWLQGFENRTVLEWWIFAFAGTGSILIALATISYQSVKAAVANPVKSLRTE